MSTDKEQILKLWRDPNFQGSFSGIKTFQTLLKLNENIDISERKLYEILKGDPLFVMHMRGKKVVSRRFYNLDYYCELVQSDLAYMFEYRGFKYFIVVIDCYSGKVFAEAIKDKSSETVKRVLIKLVNLFEYPISKFECDQGTEYSKFKQYCKENQIIFKYKYGINKANFAENIIQIIKRRLYKLLRGILSQDWPAYLEKIVRDFNETPLKKIGFLKPNQITSKFDSKKVRDALSKQGIDQPNQPLYKSLQENQQIYERNRNFIQKNDYVYVNFPESKFGKSFDYQVRLKLDFNSLQKLKCYNKFKVYPSRAKRGRR